MKKILKTLFKYYTKNLYLQIAANIIVLSSIYKITSSFWLSIFLYTIWASMLPLYRLWKQKDYLKMMMDLNADNLMAQLKKNNTETIIDVENENATKNKSINN